MLKKTLLIILVVLMGVGIGFVIGKYIVEPWIAVKWPFPTIGSTVSNEFLRKEAEIRAKNTVDNFYQARVDNNAEEAKKLMKDYEGDKEKLSEKGWQLTSPEFKGFKILGEKMSFETPYNSFYFLVRLLNGGKTTQDEIIKVGAENTETVKILNFSAGGYDVVYYGSEPFLLLQKTVGESGKTAAIVSDFVAWGITNEVISGGGCHPLFGGTCYLALMNAQEIAYLAEGEELEEVFNTKDFRWSEFEEDEVLHKFEGGEVEGWSDLWEAFNFKNKQWRVVVSEGGISPFGYNDLLYDPPESLKEEMGKGCSQDYRSEQGFQGEDHHYFGKPEVNVIDVVSCRSQDNSSFVSFLILNKSKIIKKFSAVKPAEVIVELDESCLKYNGEKIRFSFGGTEYLFDMINGSVEEL